MRPPPAQRRTLRVPPQHPAAAFLQVHDGLVEPTLRPTFDVTSTGMTGTGRLAEADGELRPAGVGAADGSFTETVTGEIPVDLSPRS